MVHLAHGCRLWMPRLSPYRLRPQRKPVPKKRPQNCIWSRSKSIINSRTLLSLIFRNKCRIYCPIIVDIPQIFSWQIKQVSGNLFESTLTGNALCQSSQRMKSELVNLVNKTIFTWSNLTDMFLAAHCLRALFTNSHLDLLWCFPHGAGLHWS